MSMTITEIERTLGQLRLSGARDTLQTRLQHAQASQMTPLETLSLLLQDELDRRQSRLLGKRYKDSGLDEKASLKDIDWSFNPKVPRAACFELQTLKFISEGSNALLIGKPGTGKSHTAKAVDLVVLDDLFLARRISEVAAEFLQTLVHQRYKRRGSILVTSNRVIQDWGTYLGDMTMASTILDRLMHRCHMLQFEGKSYRLKEAAKKLAIKTDGADQPS